MGKSIVAESGRDEAGPPGAGPVRILLVEDNPADARLLEESLVDVRAFPFELTWKTALDEAIQHAKEAEPDVVLLDLNLPDARGLETFTQFHESSPHLPVVILSGLHDEKLAFDAVRGGAQDYLVKGDHGGEVLARSVRYAIERRRTEERIQVAHRQLATLFENLEDVVFTLDPAEEALVEISPACQNVLGKPPDYFRDNPRALLVEHAHPDDKEKANALWQGLLAAENQDVEYRIERADGEHRWVHVKAKASSDSAGVARVYGTIRDVTGRKNAEKARRLAYQQKVEIERLSEMNDFKTQLLNMASHELNTPLTPLKVQLHMLRSGGLGDLKDRQRKSVDVLHRNVERLGALVADILDVARMQGNRLTVQARKMDFREVVDDVVHSFEDLAKESSIDFSVECDSDIKMVGDALRLSQVLFNLLGNAFKFTPAGGEVRFSATVEDDLLTVAVQDSGIGMEEDAIKDLFQPFTQVHDTEKTNFGGSGLGLYICKGIVEEHGGKIEALSEGHAKGSTFRFTIPLGGPPPKDEDS